MKTREEQYSIFYRDVIKSTIPTITEHLLKNNGRINPEKRELILDEIVDFSLDLASKFFIADDSASILNPYSISLNISDVFILCPKEDLLKAKNENIYNKIISNYTSDINPIIIYGFFNHIDEEFIEKYAISNKIDWSESSDAEKIMDKYRESDEILKVRTKVRIFLENNYPIFSSLTSQFCF